MLIQLLRIKSRLLVQFRVFAVVYWLILRSRGLGSRPVLVLGNFFSRRIHQDATGQVDRLTKRSFLLLQSFNY